MFLKKHAHIWDYIIGELRINLQANTKGNTAAFSNFILKMNLNEDTDLNHIETTS